MLWPVLASSCCLVECTQRGVASVPVPRTHCNNPPDCYKQQLLLSPLPMGLKMLERRELQEQEKKEQTHERQLVRKQQRLQQEQPLPEEGLKQKGSSSSTSGSSSDSSCNNKCTAAGATRGAAHTPCQQPRCEKRRSSSSSRRRRSRRRSSSSRRRHRSSCRSRPGRSRRRRRAGEAGRGGGGGGPDGCGTSKQQQHAPVHWRQGVEKNTKTVTFFHILQVQQLASLGVDDPIWHCSAREDRPVLFVEVLCHCCWRVGRCVLRKPAPPPEDECASYRHSITTPGFDGVMWECLRLLRVILLHVHGQVEPPSLGLLVVGRMPATDA